MRQNKKKFGRVCD